MQFVIFIVLVFLASLPTLSIKQSLFFTFGLLLFIILGQMILAIVFGFIREPILSVFKENPEKYLPSNPDRYMKLKIERDQLGQAIFKARFYIILCIATYFIHPYLVLPAVLGAIVQWYFEKVGAKQYSEYINKSS